MKMMLLTLTLALIGSAAVAAPVSVVEVSATGQGNPFGNAPALIVDGVTPDEVITWNGERSVSWSGKGKWIALDFDQEYELHDLVLYADSSDSFSVRVLLRNGSWSDAFLLPAPERSDSSGKGKKNDASGKETKGSSGKGDQDDEFDARVLSFIGAGLEPVFASGLIIKGDNDKGNGRYVIGKVSINGSPVAVSPVAGAPAEEQGGATAANVNLIPEPGTLALLATGLLGAGVGLRRRRT